MNTPIQPCLWFEHQAEEAARFYVSVFPNSRVGAITRYGPGMPLPEGTVLTVNFELDGLAWIAMNGASSTPFNPAVSFFVTCHSQAEVDHYWNHLAADPAAGQCGWLTDRFGVSWQIVPQQMMDLFKHPDAAGRQRAVAAMMTMKKLDIATLERAFSES
ncbi:VOC family protein [Hydrogenophaga sp. PAMC20947]|uniref:VOC family protein n=1 Tax=Hydrogenophaga sp. PAMC20947 TaxID=2565558 RepID=UPI00109DE591|nr:VOC family protein [Hydrogenophaga sp. PAMC20947]QCB48120.1 VOC family protein [Hydrogenophaga sp. PAMC20947]